jgi:ABC-type tungstate transport system permease subunit
LFHNLHCFIIVVIVVVIIIIILSTTTTTTTTITTTTTTSTFPQMLVKRLMPDVHQCLSRHGLDLAVSLKPLIIFFLNLKPLTITSAKHDLII